MNHHYEDIRSRIATPPLWFDEHAVPRYEPFAPDRTANIYATEAALLLIACQNCRAEFKVCMSCSSLDVARGYPSIEEQITRREIHFGDPPNIECCPARAADILEVFLSPIPRFVVALEDRPYDLGVRKFSHSVLRASEHVLLKGKLCR